MLQRTDPESVRSDPVTSVLSFCETATVATLSSYKVFVTVFHNVWWIRTVSFGLWSNISIIVTWLLMSHCRIKCPVAKCNVNTTLAWNLCEIMKFSAPGSAAAGPPDHVV